MARIRTIKPAHTSDKELCKISLQAHLVWVLSWCFSDDEGVMDADPLFLKSQLFPRRTDIRTEQMEQWLDQLVKARYIIPFEYEKERYYLHRTFKTHQKIDRPQVSKIPQDVIRRTLDEYSTNVQPCIGEESKGGVKESIVVRKQKFASTLEPYLETYGREMLNAFYKYWTEMGEKDRKFRREKEKTWDLKARLERWQDNQKNFSKKDGKSEKRDETTNGLKSLNSGATEILIGGNDPAGQAANH